ncbi:MAG TPA: DMT family transporter [Terriglobia bacterium]|nr:DMT family transporter [Terriglobia bacterium]
MALFDGWRNPSVKMAWIEMHACVLLWGFTAIIGKAITLEAFPLVWWRMILCIATLALFRGFWRGLVHLSARRIAAYAGIGALVAAHWVAFYGSIKLSNASAAASCMALAPVFVALLEPVIVRRPFEGRELILALASIPGVALVVGGVPVGMRAGVAIGIVSAAFAGLFGTLNKRMIDATGALTITGLEMGAGAVTLTLLAPFWPGAARVFVLPDRHDALLIVVLTVACTLLPFALSLVAMRKLSAFASALAVNMEPIYSILLAILFFHEERELGLGFYAGLAIIVGAVFSYPRIARRRQIVTSAKPDPRQS